MCLIVLLSDANGMFQWTSFFFMAAGTAGLRAGRTWKRAKPLGRNFAGARIAKPRRKPDSELLLVVEASKHCILTSCNPQPAVGENFRQIDTPVAL